MGGDLPYEIKAIDAARDPRLLGGLKPRRVQQMCSMGVFKSAHKQGVGKKSHWFISVSEIIRFKLNNHAVLQYD